MGARRSEWLSERREGLGEIRETERDIIANMIETTLGGSFLFDGRHGRHFLIRPWPSSKVCLYVQGAVIGSTDDAVFPGGDAVHLSSVLLRGALVGGVKCMTRMITTNNGMI